MKQIKRKVCIVGGSGFIGKSIIDSFNRNLLKKYHIVNILIICRNPTKLKNIKKLHSKKVKIIKGDIAKIKKLPNADYYLFLAESSDILLYKNNKYYRSKYKNSQNI